MEDHNTILDYHEAPKADPQRYLASSGKRLANYLLDRLGASLLFFVVGFFFSSVVGPVEDRFAGIYGLLILAILPGYWVLFEHFMGKTPAKFLTKTKVVTKQGEKPSFPTVVLRTVCRFIPFEPFSFLGNKPIGWHDSISGTLVVDDTYQQAARELV